MEQNDLRSLPKRPAESSTPIQPKKKVQKNDLPMWRRLPSDNKYPLPSLPTKDFQLLVKPLGKSLYESFPNQDFDLSEKAVPPALTYSSLNDPHLTNYFRSPSSQRHLVRRGLVTPEGMVMTKLEEYNQYRTYLHRLWSLQASQLIRHQEIEEKKRMHTLFEAVESEDPLCKMIVDGKEQLQVNEVMEELSVILPQGRMPSAGQVANPLLQSLLEWNKYQDKLLNDYKDKYPAIKEWLSDQTKNYKNFMENKINARISKDEKLRARWEKLRENSRSHFNRVNRFEEAEQENRKRRAEKRQKAYRKMWVKQKHLASATNNAIFKDQDVSLNENQLPPRVGEIKPKKISSESRWKDFGRHIERFEESGLLSKTLDEEMSELERSKLSSKETISGHVEASLPSRSISFTEMKTEKFGRVEDIIQNNAVYDIAGNVIDKLKRKLQRLGNCIELQKMAHLSSEETRNKSSLTTTKIPDNSARLNFDINGFEELGLLSKTLDEELSELERSKLSSKETISGHVEASLPSRSISFTEIKTEEFLRVEDIIQNNAVYDIAGNVIDKPKSKLQRVGNYIELQKMAHLSSEETRNKSSLTTTKIPDNSARLNFDIDGFEELGLLSKTLDEELSELKRSKLSSKETISGHVEASLPSRSISFTEMKTEEFGRVEDIIQNNAVYDIAVNVIDKLKRQLQRVGNYIELQKMAHLSSEETRNKSSLTTTKIPDNSARDIDGFEENPTKKSMSVKLKTKSSKKDTKFLKSSHVDPNLKIDAEKRMAGKLKLEVANMGRSISKLKKIDQKESRIANEKSLDQIDQKVQSENDMHNFKGKYKHNRLKSHIVRKQIDKCNLKSCINEPFEKDTVEIPLNEQPLVASFKETQFEQQLNEDCSHNMIFGQQLPVETPKTVLLDQQPLLKKYMGTLLDQQTFVGTTKIAQSEQQPTLKSSKEVEFEKQYFKDSENEYKLKKQMRVHIETSKEVQQIIELEYEEVKLAQLPSLKERIEDFLDMSQMYQDSAMEAQLDRQTFVEITKNVQSEQQSSVESSNEMTFGFGKQFYEDNENKYTKKQMRELVETAKEVQQMRKQESEEVQLVQQPTLKESIGDFLNVSQMHQDSATEVQLDQQTLLESSDEVKFVKQFHDDSETERKLEKQMKKLVETVKEVPKIREQESEEKMQAEKQRSLYEGITEFQIAYNLRKQIRELVEIEEIKEQETDKGRLEQQPTQEGVKDFRIDLQMHGDGTKEVQFDKQVHSDSADEAQLDQQTTKEFQLDQQPPVVREDKITSEKQLPIEIDKGVRRENQPSKYRADDARGKKPFLAESAQGKIEKQPHSDNVIKNMLTKQITELLETAKEVRKAKDFIETEKEVHLENQYSAEISPQYYKENQKGTQLELEMHVDATENMHLEKLFLEKSGKRNCVEQSPSVDTAKENYVQQHISIENANEVHLEKQSHNDCALDVELQQHPTDVNVKIIGFDEQPEKRSVKETQLEKQRLIETPREIPLEKQLTIESTKEFNFEKQPHRDDIKDYELNKDIRELVETTNKIKEGNDISKIDSKIQLQQQSSVENTKEIMPQPYSDGPKGMEFGNKTHTCSDKEPQQDKQLFVETEQDVYLERQPAAENFQFKQDLPNENGKEVKNQKQPDRDSIEHIQLDEQPVIVKDNAKNYECKGDVKELVETVKEVRQTRELVENSTDLQLEHQSSAKNGTHLYKDNHRESKLSKQSHKSYRHSAGKVQFKECPSVINKKYIEHMEQPNTDNVRGNKLENDTLVDNAIEKHFEKQAMTVDDKDIHVEKGAKEAIFKHQKLVVRVNEVSLKPETLKENPKKNLFEQQPLRKIDMAVQFQKLPLSEDAKEVPLLKQHLVRNANEIGFQQLLPEGKASEFQLEQLSLVGSAEKARFVQDSIVESVQDFERMRIPLTNIDEEVGFVEKSLVGSTKLDRHLVGPEQDQIENEVYCSWQTSKLEGTKLSLLSNTETEHPLVKSTEDVKFPNNCEKKCKLKGMKPSLALKENDSKTVKETEWLNVKNTGRILFENDVYDSTQKCEIGKSKFRVTSKETDKESSKTTENEQQPLLQSPKENQFKSSIYDSRQKYKHIEEKLRLTLKKADYDCSKIPDNQEISKDNYKNIPKRYSFLDADDLTVARKYMYEIPDCVKKGKTPQKNEISGKDLERSVIETKKIHSPDVTETIKIESVDELPLQPKANYKNLEKSNKKILENEDTSMLDNKDYKQNLSQGNSGFKSLKVSENVVKKLDTSPKRNILAKMNLKWPLKRPIKLKPDIEPSMSKTEQNLCYRFKQMPASQKDLTQGELHSESMAHTENYQDDKKLREKLSDPFYKDIFEQQKKKLDDYFIQYLLSRRISSVDSSVSRAVDCSWSCRTSYISESLAFTNSNKSQDNNDFFRNIFQENKRKLDEELVEYISNRKDKSRASTILAKNQSHVVDEAKMEDTDERVKESVFAKKECEDELDKVNKADMNKINELSEIEENKEELGRKVHTDEMDRKCETAFDKEDIFDAQKHEADSVEKVNEKVIENKEICDAKEHELKEKHDAKFNKRHEANVDEKENEEPFKKSTCNETSVEKTTERGLFKEHEVEFDSKDEQTEKKIVIEVFGTNECMQSKEAFENKIKEIDFVEESDTLFSKHDSEGFEVQLNEKKANIIAQKEKTITKIELCETENETSCKKIEDTSINKTLPYPLFLQDLLPQETVLESILHDEIINEPKSDEDEKHLRVPRKRDEKDKSKSPVRDLLPQNTTLEGILHDGITMEPKDDRDEKCLNRKVPTELDEMDSSNSSVQELLPQETILEGILHNEIINEPTSDENEKHLRVPRERVEMDSLNSSVQELVPQETTLGGILLDGITMEQTGDEDKKCLNLKVFAGQKDTSKSPIQNILPQETTLEDIIHDLIAKEPRSDEGEKYPHARVASEHGEKDTPKISVEKTVYFAQSSIHFGHKFDNTHHTTSQTTYSEPDKSEYPSSPKEVYNVVKQHEIIITDENEVRHSSAISSEDEAKTNELVPKVEPSLSKPLGSVRTKSFSYRNRLKKTETKKLSNRPKKLQPKPPHVTFDNIECHISALFPDLKSSHLNTSDSSKLPERECSTIAKIDAAKLDSQLNEDMRMESYIPVTDFNQAAEDLCRMFAVLSLKGEIESLVEQHHVEDKKTNDSVLQVSNTVVQGTSIDVLERLMSALSLGMTNYFESQADNGFGVATSNVRCSYFPENRDFTCNFKMGRAKNDRNPFNRNVTSWNRIEIDLKEYLQFNSSESERFPAKTSAGMITCSPSELIKNVRNLDRAEAKFEKTQLPLFSDQLPNSKVQSRKLPFLRTLDVNNENTEAKTKYIGSPLIRTSDSKQIFKPSPPCDQVSAINFKFISWKPSHGQDESREENLQEESNLNTSEENEESPSNDVHSFPTAKSPLKIQQNGDVEFKENQAIENTMASDVLVVGISEIEPLVQSSRVSIIQNRLKDGLLRLEYYISKPRISFKNRRPKKSKMTDRMAEKRIFMPGSIRDETIVSEDIDSEE